MNSPLDFTYDDKIYLQPSATVALPPVAKSQTDTLRLIFDYTSWLNVGEFVLTAAMTILPSSVPALAPDQGEIASNLAGLPGALVYYDLSGGVYPASYTATLAITTNTARTKTDLVAVNVDCAGATPFPGGYAISDPTEQPALPTVWQGVGLPYSELGVVGDYYFNMATRKLYGPKTTVWPSTQAYSMPTRYKWNSVV